MTEEFPKQSNPTRPRLDQKNRRQQWAHAPYNFVPLPERVVPAPFHPKAEGGLGFLDQDEYHQQAGEHSIRSGWIDCELETYSPVYIRGMLSAEQWEKHREAQEGKDGLSWEQKKDAAPFFGVGEPVEGRPAPMIPGSSLRGMIRSLVEIAGYGAMRWVGGEPTFTYRAVAAQNDDPLREPYRAVLGAFGKNVRAGYLVCEEKEGQTHWFIHPARTPSALGLPSQETYLKVKEHTIGSQDIPGYVRFNSSAYTPQAHRVSFNVETRTSRRGKFAAVSAIGTEGQHPHRGYLVCSGNMLETGDTQRQKSPRKNHALVLERDTRAKAIEIPPEVIEAYRKGLTDFQKEEVHKAWVQARGGEKAASDEGCLVEGMPVFFVEAKGKVEAFGHSPNFRVPALLNGGQRAAVPSDFVPEAVRPNSESRDLAEAIFGWVQEDAQGRTVEDTKKKNAARAGRVFFSDARFQGASQGVWYKDSPITLRILGTPKPTTFQHYLVQDGHAGHSPDEKSSLAHYGTETPDGTVIRGYKRYWHRGATPDIEATLKELERKASGELKRATQLTRVSPLKPGVRFRFKIHFENLCDEELGALLWALMLPGSSDATYYHKIGMGKPLGMGAVKITPTLWVTDRAKRYSQLFEGDSWYEAETETETAPFIAAFERYVLDKIDSSAARLADEERIQMLLTMLQWREGTKEWLAETRYMEIEQGSEKVNEYKERPVLPDPLVVAGVKVAQADAPRQRTTTMSAPRQTPSTPRREAREPEAEITLRPAPRPAAPPPAPRVPTLPAVGDTFTSPVLDADETVALIEIPGFPQEKAIGIIRAERFDGKRYQPGASARVEVISVRARKDGAVLVELKPGQKQQKKK